jgi:hypothetical protein
VGNSYVKAENNEAPILDEETSEIVEFEPIVNVEPALEIDELEEYFDSSELVDSNFVAEPILESEIDNIFENLIEPEKLEKVSIPLDEIFENINYVKDTVNDQVEIDSSLLSGQDLGKTEFYNWEVNKNVAVSKLLYQNQDGVGWYFFHNINGEIKNDRVNFKKSLKRISAADKIKMETFLESTIKDNLSDLVFSKYKFAINESLDDQFYFKISNISSNSTYDIWTFQLYFDEFEVEGQTLQMYFSVSEYNLAAINSHTYNVFFEFDIEDLTLVTQKLLKQNIDNLAKNTLNLNSLNSDNIEIVKTILVNPNWQNFKNFNLLFEENQIQDLSNIFTLGASVVSKSFDNGLEYLLDPNDMKIIGVENNNYYIDESVEDSVPMVDIDPIESESDIAVPQPVEEINVPLLENDSEVGPIELVADPAASMENLDTNAAVGTVSDNNYVLRVLTNTLDDDSNQQIINASNLKIIIDDVQEYTLNKNGEVTLNFNPASHKVETKLQTDNFKIYNSLKSGDQLKKLDYIGPAEVDGNNYYLFQLTQDVVLQSAFIHFNKVSDFFTKLFDSADFGQIGTALNVLVDSEASDQLFHGCASYYQVSTISIHLGSGYKCGYKNHALALDLIGHEYTHFIINKMGSFSYYLQTASASIHEAIADYFSYRITGNAIIGENSILKPRDIGTLHVLDLETSTQFADTYEKAEILGSIFYELNDKIGSDFDITLLGTAFNNIHTFNDFMVQLLLNDDDNNNLIDGTPNQQLIIDTFAKSGLIDDYDLLFDPLLVKDLLPEDLQFAAFTVQSPDPILDFGLSNHIYTESEVTEIIVNANLGNGAEIFVSSINENGSSGLYNEDADYEIEPKTYTELQSGESGLTVFLVPDEENTNLVVDSGFDVDNVDDEIIGTDLKRVAYLIGDAVGYEKLFLYMAIKTDQLMPIGLYEGDLRYYVMLTF